MEADLTDSITVRRVPATVTLALRHAVLRPGRPYAEARFDFDDADTTVHLAAFDANLASKWGEPVGVVTLAHEPMPGQPMQGDWRLRGMAVDPGYRGYGVGRTLIQQSVLELETRRAQRLWCNARLTAAGFYRRMGFAAHGRAFDIAGIGPHVVMAIAVASGSR